MVAFILFCLLICLVIDYRNFVTTVRSRLKKLSDRIDALEVHNRPKEEPVSEQQENSELYAYLQENETSEFSETPTVTKTEEVTETSDEAFEEIKTENEAIFDNLEKIHSFENIFMSNIFNKIGAVAIIIAAFIFLKVLSDLGIFSPVIKIMTGFLAGLVMIFTSLKIHKENTKNYAEVLMGTGFAVMFITSYCGCYLMNVIPYWLGIVIGLLIVTASFFLAEKFNTFSTVAVGLIGGYINPLLSVANTSSEFLFGYFIVLNLFSILYVYKNPDKAALNYVNILLTTIIVLCASIYTFTPKLIFPVLFWAVYLANDIAFIKTDRPKYELIKPLNYINYLCLIFYTCYVFHFTDRTSIGLTVFCVGLIYGLCAYLFRKSRNSDLYINGTLLSLLISTYFVTSGVQRICLLSAVALLVTIILTHFEKKSLYNWLYIYYSAILAFVCIQKGVFGYAEAEKQLFSFQPQLLFGTGSNVLLTKLTLFGVPALSAFLSTKMIKGKNEYIHEALKLFCVSFVYLFVIAIINTLFLNHGGYKIQFTKLLIYSGIASLYSINVQIMNLKVKYYAFQFLEIIFYVISVMLLALGMTEIFVNHSRHLIPFCNIGTIAFVSLTAATLYKNKYSQYDYFAYCAAILGLLLFSYELGAIKCINLSIIWTIYAGLIMLLGIFRDIKVLKKCGIGIIILTIGKILFVDMASVNTYYKMLIFLLLGVSLLVVSYFYNKSKK